MFATRFHPFTHFPSYSWGAKAKAVGPALNVTFHGVNLTYSTEGLARVLAELSAFLPVCGLSGLRSLHIKMSRKGP